MRKIILIISIILLFASPVFAESLQDWLGEDIEVYFSSYQQKTKSSGKLTDVNNDGIFILDSSRNKMFIYDGAIQYIVLK